VDTIQASRATYRGVRQALLATKAGPTLKNSLVRQQSLSREKEKAASGNLQVQNAFSVQVTNLLLVLFGDLQMAQPVSGGAIRLIRPVN
jgi:hypothetical protein